MPQKARILLSAANLHNGGSVAVAASVIHALAQDRPEQVELAVLVSPEVHLSVQSLGTAVNSFSHYFVVNHDGVRALWARLPLNPKGFDRVLNVFGPVYSIALARDSICGFAQPWIAFPDNGARDLLSPTTRLIYRIKFAIHSRFFLLPRTLVVEQETVRSALKRRRAFRNTDIRVVPNVVDEVHYDPSRWSHLDLPAPEGDFRIGVIGRDYPHKNLGVIPEVKRSLNQEHGIKADFLVTLPQDEWAARSDEFREAATNLGPLTLAQCPNFYRSVDVVLFPSLLECFSATPIEAKAAGVPLVSSDLEVIRETVGDYPEYVNARSPADMAAKLARTLAAPRADSLCCEPERRVRLTARDRAQALLDLAVKSCVNGRRSAMPSRGSGFLP